MRIAIFHNLHPGGAIKLLEKTSIELIKLKHEIDIYALNEFTPDKITKKIFTYKTPKTTNAFNFLISAIFTENQLCKKIAKKIIKNKYDLILVFPSLTTQSPHILKYLPKNKTIYLFTETKREYYETTNFFNFKKLILKYFLLPLKFTDIKNCKNASNIITISQYSSSLLKKTYNKNSFIIYPGLQKTKQKVVSLKHNHKAISIGIITKLKGHHFSIKQIGEERNIKKLTIVGRKTQQSHHITKRKNKKTNFLFHVTDKKKRKLLKENSFFLANQENEPFGIATLEAIDSNCFIFGKNEAGTSEIVKHGLDGFLYPDNIKTAKACLEQKLRNSKINIIKTSKINWAVFTEKLLSVYHYLKNEPNY